MHTGRNPEHARQTGYLTDIPGASTPICFWCHRKMAVINLKRLNQSVKTKHFKMESINMLKGPAKSRQLDGQNRSKRCILYDSHGSEAQRIPLIAVNIPVQLPAIRSVISSVDLYQDHRSSYGNPVGMCLITSWQRQSLY